VAVLGETKAAHNRRNGQSIVQNTHQHIDKANKRMSVTDNNAAEQLLLEGFPS
jgi:hypothetical protein